MSNDVIFESQAGEQAQVPSLELAQLFIQANGLIAEQKNDEARTLLEEILNLGNASQKNIAKELMLKVDNAPSPSDALALTSVAVEQLTLEPALPVDGSILNEQTDVQRRQGIRVGALNLMMQYADGTELTDVPHLYHVPNSPSWLLGTINLHGVVIPVFDLVDYFGIDAPEQHAPMMLILSKAEHAVGVVINGLPERLSFDEASQKANKKLAPESLSPFVKSAVMLNGVLWFDIDVNALLDGLESRLSG